MRRHYVVYSSPGTFVDEETSREVAAWDVEAAAAGAADVTERHGAKPYGFQFVTVLVADPIPDGEGGTLAVEPREVARSGMHFLGGTLLTLDSIRQRADPRDSILISNMEGNDWPVVVENNNSWRTVRPFGEEDCIVVDGRVVRCGDEPKLVEYRRRKIEERRAELERLRTA